MKKLLAFILALIFVLSFAACGEERKKSDRSLEDLFGGGDANESRVQIDINTDVSVDETVIIDESGIKVTAKSVTVTKDSYYPYCEITLYAENNTSKAFNFVVEDLCINDCVMDSSSDFRVASGKKTNEIVNVSLSYLAEYGVKEISDIDFYLKIYDDEYDEYIYSDTVTLTNRAATGIVSYDESGSVIYDNNGIKMICKDFDAGNAEEYISPKLKLCIINNTGKSVDIKIKDTSVNGYMVESSFYCDIPVGKRSVDTLYFEQSDLDNNGISTFETVEFYLHVTDDNWDTVFDSGTITLTFSR